MTSLKIMRKMISKSNKKIVTFKAISFRVVADYFSKSYKCITLDEPDGFYFCISNDQIKNTINKVKMEKSQVVKVIARREHLRKRQ